MQRGGAKRAPYIEVKAEAEKAVPSRVPGRADPWAELFLDYRPTSG